MAAFYLTPFLSLGYSFCAETYSIPKYVVKSMPYEVQVSLQDSRMNGSSHALFKVCEWLVESENDCICDKLFKDLPHKGNDVIDYAVNKQNIDVVKIITQNCSSPENEEKWAQLFLETFGMYRNVAALEAALHDLFYRVFTPRKAKWHKNYMFPLLNNSFCDKQIVKNCSSSKNKEVWAKLFLKTYGKYRDVTELVVMLRALLDRHFSPKAAKLIEDGIFPRLKDDFSELYLLDMMRTHSCFPTARKDRRMSDYLFSGLKRELVKQNTRAVARVIYQWPMLKERLDLSCDELLMISANTRSILSLILISTEPTCFQRLSDKIFQETNGKAAFDFAPEAFHRELAKENPTNLGYIQELKADFPFEFMRKKTKKHLHINFMKDIATRSQKLNNTLSRASFMVLNY